MASTAALELVVALNDQASKGMDDIAEKGGGMGDAIKGGAAIAGGAILGLGAILVGATKAAADDEAEVARLNNTLKNSIPNWDGNTAAVDALITKGQNLAFTDSELRDSIGFLVGQTGSLTEAQELQATAMDLARAKGISLEQATKAVGKVDNESMGILKKLGITVDEHATKEEALAAIRAQSAGQAETYANSSAGAMVRIQNSLGEAFETVGSAILPLVEGPLAALAAWFSSPEVQAGIQTIATGIGTMLTNAFTMLQSAISFIMPIIQPFIDAIVSFFGTISSGGDIMGAFGQYFTDIGAAIGNAWAVIGPALGTLLGSIVQFIVDNGPTILATLLQWAVNFGTWIWNDAIPALLGALGGLIQGVWNFIIENGPTILATLAEWTTAFFTWVWNDALPALLGALGGLISGVWTFIVDNGPTILAKLWEWTQAFFNWVMNDLLPQVPGWLLTVVTTVWTFITENGPTILGKLLEWTAAFFSWIFTDLLPQVPGWLANIVGALWTFITENGPVLLGKLAEWTTAFFDWVMTDIVPQIPTWLGNIAGALWTWLSETAIDLSDKLINEWIPALWNWLVGPGGILETLPYKLNEIWTGISEWIGTTASDMLDAAVGMGESLYNGILEGIGGLGEALWNFISGIAQGIWDSLVSFFTGGGDKKELPVEPPKKAMGGPVTGGMPYIVGERGPELFVPGGSGSIIPNGRMMGMAGSYGGGGGTTINLTVNAGWGSDGRGIAQAILEELEYALGDQIAIRTGSRTRP